MDNNNILQNLTMAKLGYERALEDLEDIALGCEENCGCLICEGLKDLLHAIESLKREKKTASCSMCQARAKLEDEEE